VTVNTVRLYADVFEGLVEAALFPGTIYSSPPYAAFSVSDYTADRIFKGALTFKRKSAKSKMPFVGWFLNETDDFAFEQTQVQKITGQVVVITAHQNPKIEIAWRAAMQDRTLVEDICQQNLDEQGLLYGPFGVNNTAVVPSSFGLVTEIDCGFSNKEIGVQPALGPDVVVASIALNITLNVA